MAKRQLTPALTFLTVLGVALVVLVPARAATRQDPSPVSGLAPAGSPVSSGGDERGMSGRATTRPTATTGTTGTTGTNRTASTRSSSTSDGSLAPSRRESTSEGSGRATKGARPGRRDRSSRASPDTGEEWALQRALERLRDDLARPDRR